MARIGTTLALLGALCLAAAPAVPHPDEEALPFHGTRAKPLERQPPAYPRFELKRERQGWVQLSFVVTKSGEVVDPIVEDSSGSSLFEDAALDAARQWRFEPATREGEPIEQSRTRVMIRFTIDPKRLGATSRFHRIHAKISGLLENGEIDRAKRLITETGNGRLNLYEVARLWMLKAIVAGEEGDQRAQLAALKRAAAGGGDYVEDNLYPGLLRAILALQIRLGDYGTALGTSEEYFAAGGDEEGLGPLAEAVEQIRASAAGDAPILVEAAIGGAAACEDCRTSWHYRPLRRAFSIDGVNGAAERLEIRCDWHRYSDRVREGITWEIPKSWGDCRVIVTGEKGTRFNFYELPDA